MKEKKSYIEWNGMNRDVLGLIVRRLGFEDFDAFGCVCSSWRLVAHEEKPDLRARRLPWLMLADRDTTVEREFYVLSRGETYPILLPELKEKKMCLSSLGWIMSIDRGWNVQLLNPFCCPREAPIKLPGLDLFHANVDDRDMAFYPHFVQKFALSTRPSSSSAANYMVMVLADSRGELGFWKPGDKRWSFIESTTVPSCNLDILYYKGQFVVVDILGRIKACNFDNGQRPAKAQVVLELPKGLFRSNFINQEYLVELDGWLLLISREGESSGDPTGFQVFRLDIEGRAWTELNSLGNSSVFLGYNSSFSLKIGEARHPRVKPNCIYFTDDYFELYSDEEGGGKDMGIYHMEDGRIEPCFDGESFCHVCPPIWLEPS